MITNHLGGIDKPVEFFERKLQSIASQKSVMTAFTGVNKSAVYASYIAAYQIAKQKKPHDIGENLLMPVMKDFVKIMVGEKESKKLDSVSISATAVKRRIVDMSHDVLEQIVSQVNASPFYAIQLDESTDIAGLPQLSLIIRYISDGKVLEELLFGKPLHLHTRGEESLRVLMDSLTKIQYHGINVPEFVPMVQRHVPVSIRELLNESKTKHQM